MATYDADAPTYDFVDGRKYITWTYSNLGLGTTDYIKLSCVPKFCTMTLFEADASEVMDPAIGKANNFDVGAETIVENQTPATCIRNQARVQLTTDGTLYVKPKLDASSEINVALTVVEGH